MEKEKNKTELEEVIETIKNSYVMSTKHCLDDENTRLRQAIEVVLQALERYKRLAEANLKDSEEFKNNMCEHRCILKSELQELQESSIPKKKIEDRIKELWKEKQELQDEYDKNIDKWIEEGKKAANEHKDRFTTYIPAREEIGIEQKIQNILGAIIELEKICNKF